MNRAMAFGFAVFVSLVSIHSQRGGAGAFPDAWEFSRGASCWSSVAACRAGSFAGRDGVLWLSALGAAGSVYWIARLASWRGLAFLGVSLLTPFGWNLLGMGADSFGALAVIVALGSRHRLVGSVVACAAHLSAGLACLAAVLCRRFGLRYTYTRLLLSFGLGEAVTLRLLGVLTHSTEVTQLQWRYMLPGTVFLCARAVMGRSAVPKVVYASA